MENEKLIKGIFLKDIKGRFRCEVLLEGIIEICYFPMPYKIGKKIDLKNKEVLLRRLNKKSKYAYGVFAIKIFEQFILFDTKYCNNLFKDEINNQLFDYIKKGKELKAEIKINNYRADFFYKDVNTVIEIKSVINFSKTALFPFKDVNRAINQLEEFKKLLVVGYNVYYIIFSLTNETDTVAIDKSNYKFYELFIQCINSGMKCMAVKTIFSEKNFKIDKEISISY